MFVEMRLHGTTIPVWVNPDKVQWIRPLPGKEAGTRLVMSTADSDGDATILDVAGFPEIVATQLSRKPK